MHICDAEHLLAPPVTLPSSRHPLHQPRQNTTDPTPGGFLDLPFLLSTTPRAHLYLRIIHVCVAAALLDWGHRVPSTQHHVGSWGFRSLLPCSAFVNVTGKREGPGYLFIVKVLIFAQVIHNSQISRAHRDNSPNSPIPQVFTAFPQVPHVMFSFFLQLS